MDERTDTAAAEMIDEPDKIVTFTVARPDGTVLCKQLYNSRGPWPSTALEAKHWGRLWIYGVGDILPPYRIAVDVEEVR